MHKKPGSTPGMLEVLQVAELGHVPAQDLESHCYSEETKPG